MGKHFQYISINTICEALRPRKAKALPLIHALTGCDTTSSFQGRGKECAWDALNAYQEDMEAFLSVLDGKFTALDADSVAFSVIDNLLLFFTTKTVLQEESSSPNKGDHWKVFFGTPCESVGHDPRNICANFGACTQKCRKNH